MPSSLSASHVSVCGYVNDNNLRIVKWKEPPLIWFWKVALYTNAWAMYFYCCRWTSLWKELLCGLPLHPSAVIQWNSKLLRAIPFVLRYIHWRMTHYGRRNCQSNLVYSKSDPHVCRLDVYSSINARSSGVLVLFVYGSATPQSKRLYAPMASRLRDLGYIVVVPQYRQECACYDIREAIKYATKIVPSEMIYILVTILQTTSFYYTWLIEIGFWHVYANRVTGRLQTLQPRSFSRTCSPKWNASLNKTKENIRYCCSNHWTFYLKLRVCSCKIRCGSLYLHSDYIILFYCLLTSRKPKGLPVAIPKASREWYTHTTHCSKCRTIYWTCSLEFSLYMVTRILQFLFRNLLTCTTCWVRLCRQSDAKMWMFACDYTKAWAMYSVSKVYTRTSKTS